jgi:hypothetical protein
MSSQSSAARQNLPHPLQRGEEIHGTRILLTPVSRRTLPSTLRRNPGSANQDPAQLQIPKRKEAAFEPPVLAIPITSDR